MLTRLSLHRSARVCFLPSPTLMSHPLFTCDSLPMCDAIIVISGASCLLVATYCPTCPEGTVG
jgi:hypothetical protein